jgi:hypothetical protein
MAGSSYRPCAQCHKVTHSTRMPSSSMPTDTMFSPKSLRTRVQQSGAGAATTSPPPPPHGRRTERWRGPGSRTAPPPAQGEGATHAVHGATSSGEEVDRRMRPTCRTHHHGVPAAHEQGAEQPQRTADAVGRKQQVRVHLCNGSSRRDGGWGGGGGVRLRARVCSIPRCAHPCRIPPLETGPARRGRRGNR